MANKSKEITLAPAVNLKDLDKAFSLAAGMIDTLQKRVNGLKFNPLNKALNDNAKSWSKSMEQKALTRLNKELREQLEFLPKTTSAVDKMASAVHKLAREEERLGKGSPELSKAKNSITASFERSAAIKNIRGEQRKKLDHALKPFTLLKTPVKEMMAFEEAMQEVRLSMSPEKFEAARKEILALGRSLPVAHNELAKLYAIGPRTGVKDLEKFATDAVKIGLVMGKSSEEVAKIITSQDEADLELKVKYSTINVQEAFEDYKGSAAESVQILRNSLMELNVTLGTELLPTINRGAKHLGLIINKVTDFANANPRLTSGVTKAVTSLLGMKAAAAGLGYAATFILGPLNAMRTLFTTFQAAKIISGLGSVKTAVSLLGAVVTANPIMAAITAIAGGALLIYQNWDKIGEWFSSKFNRVSEAFQKGWDKIGEWFSSKIDGVSEAFQKGWGSGVLQVLIDFNPVALISDAVSGLINYFIGLDIDIWGSIKAKTEEFIGWLGETFGWVKDGLQSVSKALNGNIQLVNPTDNPEAFGLDPEQSFARGGVVNRPTLALIGEGGDAESVIPHNRSARSMELWADAGRAIGAFTAEGAGSIQVSFSPVQNFYGQANEQAVTQANRMSIQELKRMLGEIMRDDRRLSLS